MLYWLIAFSDQINILNVFRYLTVRTGGAMITALIFVFLFGPWIIDHLRLRQGKGQPIRADGPQSHLVTKRGTPTMGGLMILSGVLFSTVLWANPANPYVWIVLGVTIGFGFIGWCDDLKVRQGTHGGFFGALGFMIETIVAVIGCLAIVSLGWKTLMASLSFSFTSEFVVSLAVLFIGLATFVVVAAGNLFNLADKLYGGAIGLMIASVLSLAFIAYFTGNPVYARYLDIHYVAGVGELAVLCAGVTGAALGFVWLRAPTAPIFMGSTASLALGGLVGAVAVATQQKMVAFAVAGLIALGAGRG